MCVFLFCLFFTCNVQNVKDAAVVALPFAENEIRDSVNMVLEKLGDVAEVPNQVISITKKAIMG